MKSIGNVVVGQSGGPTAVINASLAGVYQAAKDMGAAKVFGMVHGIQGLLERNLISLEEQLPDSLSLELLKRTPSSFLGTCRFKLPEISGNEAVYEQVFAVLEEYSIGLLVYIGGNDSMDTIKMLSDYAAIYDKPQRFVGVPKTVDNDLPITDHCPGYGSAAKYIATSLKEVIRDVQSTGLTRPTVLLVEIMGRHAGWLAAAAALAKGTDCDGADAIYLPEHDFDLDSFVEHIQETGSHKNTVVIALSEGIRLADGRFVSELGGDVEDVDVFGHKQLGGCGLLLADIAAKRTGFKTRAIELSTLQRSAAHLAAMTDIEEAYGAGAHAVTVAMQGHTGVMITLNREQQAAYRCTMGYYDIHSIANGEKTVPVDWITKDGRGLTEDFLNYAKPLIRGEQQPVYVDGLPMHLVRSR